MMLPPPPLFLSLHVYYNITFIGFSTTIRILNNINIQRSYSDFNTRDMAPFYMFLQASIKSGSLSIYKHHLSRDRNSKSDIQPDVKFESKSGRLNKSSYLLKALSYCILYGFHGKKFIDIH